MQLIKGRLRMLSILNYKMDQMAEDLNNLKRVNNIEKNIPKIMKSFFEKFDIPLSSMEELNNLEVHLENEEKKKEAVSY